MSVIKFDKFIVIEAGKYTLLSLIDLVGKSFTDRLRVEFIRKETNNGMITICPIFGKPVGVDFPVKFSNLLKNQESVLITIPYVSIIWFTQYGNRYLRITYGDDLFKVLQETKRLITLAKRAHSKTDDTKA